MTDQAVAKNLSYSDTLDIDLRGARLPGVDLAGADFSDGKLSQIVLSDADLRGIDLSRANLSGADLRRADLRKANLTGACLAAADLCRVDARGAVFEATDFRGAQLDSADLRGVDLSSARNLAGQAIVDAFLDSGTRLSEETAEGVRAWVGAQRALKADEDWLRNYLKEHLDGLAEAFLLRPEVKQ